MKFKLLKLDSELYHAVLVVTKEKVNEFPNFDLVKTNRGYHDIRPTENEIRQIDLDEEGSWFIVAEAKQVKESKYYKPHMTSLEILKKWVNNNIS